MKLLTGAGVLASVVLISWTAWDIENSLRRKRGAKAASAAGLPAGYQPVPMDLQEACASQARREFGAIPIGTREQSDYLSHYNQTLNRCFIRIDSTIVRESTVLEDAVYDAFARKEYARYTLYVPQGESWDRPPAECHSVTLPSGEMQYCKTKDQFEEMIKPFMEGVHSFQGAKKAGTK